MMILLAIGSNVRQTQNIAEAKRRLRRLLPSIVFGQEVWTDPVGLQSDRFLNLLAYADTTFSPAELQQRLKQIEREMGDSHENHQGGRVPNTMARPSKRWCGSNTFSPQNGIKQRPKI